MVKDNAFLIDRFTWRESLRGCTQAIHGTLLAFFLSLPEIGNEHSIPWDSTLGYISHNWKELNH
jgi:hypothetical protein